MGRNKNSIIWKVSKENFEKIVKDSETYKDVLLKLGLPAKSGGNYKTLKQRLILEKINISHIENNKKLFRGESSLKKSLKDYLVIGSCISTSRLRKRLIEEGIIENKCSECGQLPLWNNKILVLQLDHINGNHTDNRLENLRILCPHCHSQTETYGGKNAKVILDSDFCKCGNKKTRESNSCKKCRKYEQKIIWPNIDILEKMLIEKPTTQIAKELGVSDSMVSYYAKKMGIKKPSRGYWSKRRAMIPHP